MTTTTTIVYSVNTVDSETWPAAFATAGVATVTPGAQDSGRCRYAVTVQSDACADFERALADDAAVIDFAVDDAAADAWWEWHDADRSRTYSTMDEAETACADWVSGRSDIGPDRA